MQGFLVRRGPTALYVQDQVDTDRIIPARFLTRIERGGYGELLFCDVRGEDFPLDRPEAKGAKFLIVGANFGCGSSREHAVWALQQAGFEAVIARRTAQDQGFSDIFRQNSANCGLLLIELDEAGHARLAALGQGVEIEVDLPAQMIRWAGGEAAFEIHAGTKRQVMEGLDLIGSTLQHEADIAAFEARESSFAP
jgi:3-isopropylmalate/(R)-2-methylmalate dehydratase small subunit